MRTHTPTPPRGKLKLAGAIADLIAQTEMGRRSSPPTCVTYDTRAAKKTLKGRANPGHHRLSFSILIMVTWMDVACSVDRRALEALVGTGCLRKSYCRACDVGPEAPIRVHRGCWCTSIDADHARRRLPYHSALASRRSS
jgi:hypothetical protein